ncbi:hypothetical protein MLD38_027599 [Melastoma candidum]|uniref:Uncharacterized protein n=1 Tax=Melastoma candidum TaxID=119954 RepID=A0ACB9P6S7_9MYRT|nr:hypothetical protein MLD38_027599 [Melastoma candidum]
MVVFSCGSVSFPCWRPRAILIEADVGVPLREFLSGRIDVVRIPCGCSVLKSKGTRPENARIFCHRNISAARIVGKKTAGKGKKEHHLWKKRDATGSGKKARSLLRAIADLPNEKEVVYGVLDKWIAWEPEFPLIAAAKALRMLRIRNQWVRAIQVAKWMLSKGQGTTLSTYDTLLLAFDMDKRVDEAESLWNMILHAHTRSLSKQLFSRMISLYDHHEMPEKLIEVFADMEELGVRPDEDTTRRVAYAFNKLGQEDKQKLVLKRYRGKWKYIHFNGERVRVKRDPWEDP